MSEFAKETGARLSEIIPGADTVRARERFMSHVEVLPDEHWRWKPGGREWFRMGGSGSKAKHAPRAGWLLWRGEVPAGFVVCRCSISWCVNPYHASLGREDVVKQERAARTTYPRGDDVSRSVLTAALVRRAIRLWNSGRTVRQIHGRLGADVTPRAIQAAIDGRSWRHLGLVKTRRGDPARYGTSMKRGEQSVRAVLTDEQVLLGRHFRACGYIYSEAWRRLGKPGKLATFIGAVRGLRYRHLPNP